MPRLGSLLDIGAGEGNVTAQLAALFSGTVCSETNRYAVLLCLVLLTREIISTEHEPGRTPFNVCHNARTMLIGQSDFSLLLPPFMFWYYTH